MPARDTVLLRTLESLVSIDATHVRSALDAAADVVSQALGAEKVDVFVLDEGSSTLVAMGTSRTPLGRKQKEVGLDRLPLANGGRIVAAQRTGEAFVTDDLRRAGGEVPGLTDALGIRSMILVPVERPGRPRAVLSMTSTETGKWSAEDLPFSRAVAAWVGQLIHRAELVERLAGAAREDGRRAAAEELVTVLAHELRNYLSPLRGRLALIERRAVRDGREADRRDADLATRSLGRLTRMIDDLLDVGRIDAGLFRIDPEPTDVAALVHAIVEEMHESGHAVDVSAPGDLVAEVDPRIRHAVENLIGNAVKHSPAGAPVAVEVRREPGAGRAWAAVSVANVGDGIPEAVLPNLFDRFARGPGSSGLGLGLYVARELARAHGGDITVEAVPGQRTTFTLRVPMAR